MRKPINEYKAIILDMDGTLYFQTPVRVFMALSLALHYVVHPVRLKELLVLRSYRQLRENRVIADCEDFTERQFQLLSEKYDLSVPKIKSVVNYWMQERPLRFVRSFRDKQLIAIVEQLRAKGLEIIVYSDYPVADKVSAVGIAADYMFHADDKKIKCIKPDPKGLKNILEIIGLPAEDCLFIGDRYEKDGLCAESVEMDYIILSKQKRRQMYSHHKCNI